MSLVVEADNGALWSQRVPTVTVLDKGEPVTFLNQKIMDNFTYVRKLLNIVTSVNGAVQSVLVQSLYKANSWLLPST